MGLCAIHFVAFVNNERLRPWLVKTPQTWIFTQDCWKPPKHQQQNFIGFESFFFFLVYPFFFSILDISVGNNTGLTHSFSFSALIQKVIAMYPYDASRADELTIQPGDVITVLFIDSENWWMGELADGRQGYFPSNYVMEQGEIQETLTNNCKRKASVHLYSSNSYT